MKCCRMQHFTIFLWSALFANAPFPLSRSAPLLESLSLSWTNSGAGISSHQILMSILGDLERHNEVDSQSGCLYTLRVYFVAQIVGIVDGNHEIHLDHNCILSQQSPSVRDECIRMYMRVPHRSKSGTSIVMIISIRSAPHCGPNRDNPVKTYLIVSEGDQIVADCVIRN